MQRLLQINCRYFFLLICYFCILMYNIPTRIFTDLYLKSKTVSVSSSDSLVIGIRCMFYKSQVLMDRTLCCSFSYEIFEFKMSPPIFFFFFFFFNIDSLSYKQTVCNFHLSLYDIYTSKYNPHCLSFYPCWVL